jgi:hypothetical protein
MLLLKTGIATVVSALFGSYTDKREIQVAMNGHANSHDYSAEPELWFDYMADTGDGFDATQTMAQLVACEALKVNGVDNTLPRGRFLLLGGDEVYPSASRKEYRDRFQGPFEAAFPYVEEGKERPHLYAIPGNHDWYDGLTSFLRIFRRDNSVGAWKIRQDRSYFAIKLPNNWWIWAIDIALDSYIDTPQVEYFNAYAQKLGEQDRVILCSSEPSWVYAHQERMEPWKNLDYIAQMVVDAGARVSVNLTGDLHHFALYVDEAEKDNEDSYSQVKITSGGGGAFLHPTHVLPDKLALTETGRQRSYSKKSVYPNENCSRSLSLMNFNLPLKHWPLTVFMGVFYLTYIWMVSAISTFNGETFLNNEFIDYHDVLSNFAHLQLLSPGLLLFHVLFIIGLYLYCEPRLAPETRIWKLLRFIVALIHAMLHLATLLYVFYLFTPITFESHVLLPRFVEVLVFAAKMIVVGGIAGGFILGLYLIVSDQVFGFNYMNAYSSLAIDNYKHFLRIHVHQDGLTIYPVAVDQVNRKWTLEPNADYFKPWFSASREIKFRIIDNRVIHIRNQGEE